MGDTVIISTIVGTVVDVVYHIILCHSLNVTQLSSLCNPADPTDSTEATSTGGDSGCIRLSAKSS